MKLLLAIAFASALLAPENASAASASLLNVALNGFRPSRVVRITVIRNSPEVVGRMFTINSDRIKTVYSLRLDITADVPELIDSIKDALAEETAKGGCPHVTVSANEIEVGWGILLYDYDRNEIAEIALSRGGACAVVRGKLYSVSGDFVNFLVRTFPFMQLRSTS